MSPRGFSVRLFLSCWLVYCLHLATDFTREHFLISSIVERHTFTMDPYSGMHDDLFTFTDGHTYHGANPGIARRTGQLSGTGLSCRQRPFRPMGWFGPESQLRPSNRLGEPCLTSAPRHDC